MPPSGKKIEKETINNSSRNTSKSNNYHTNSDKQKCSNFSGNESNSSRNKSNNYHTNSDKQKCSNFPGNESNNRAISSDLFAAESGKITTNRNIIIKAANDGWSNEERSIVTVALMRNVKSILHLSESYGHSKSFFDSLNNSFPVFQNFKDSTIYTVIANARKLYHIYDVVEETEQEVIKIERDSTLSQDVRKLLLNKISTESSASNSKLNYFKTVFTSKLLKLEAGPKIREKSEKITDKEEKHVHVKEKKKQYDDRNTKKRVKNHRTRRTGNLNYRQIRQQVAIARTRVVEQRRKVVYCAVGESDFERAWQICVGLKSEDFWMMLKSWPSNYRFPIEIPSLYPLCLMVLINNSTLLHGEDTDSEDPTIQTNTFPSVNSGYLNIEEDWARQQITSPVENLADHASLDELFGDFVLEHLQEPCDQENGFVPNVQFYRIHSNNDH